MKSQKYKWEQYGFTFIFSFILLFFFQSMVYGGWTSVSPPSISNQWGLASVHFTSADEGWAVGSDYENGKGVLLHYSGGTWISVKPPEVDTLHYLLDCVHFTSVDEGWAVGLDYENDKGVLLHFSGGTWTSVDLQNVVNTPNWRIRSIHFTSGGTGWAVGTDYENEEGILLRYSGGDWALVTPPKVNIYRWGLHSVYFSSASDGWTVGQSYYNNEYVLLHYSNGNWTSAYPPDLGSLEGVHFTSANDGWAVGVFRYNNTVRLSHYSGGSWSSLSPPAITSQWCGLNSVYFTSADEGWAVGWKGYNNDGCVLLQYSGGTWTLVTPPEVSTSGGLSSVYFISSDEGWAVGSNNYNTKGALLHYTKDPEVIQNDPKCISTKVKTTKKLCSALLKCYSKGMKTGASFDPSSCLGPASSTFRAGWDKAEGKATKKGLGCDTGDADTILAIIDGDDVGLDAIRNEITDPNNLNTNTKYGANLAASLLKIAGTYCSSIFKAESANIKKINTEKLNGILGKAETKFQSSWDKAIAKALKKGTTYNGDIATIEGLIDDMVDDVLDGLQ